jgi:hypothetical protein
MEAPVGEIGTSMLCTRLHRASGPALLLMAISASACIVRPGMNRDCQWPPEASRPLDLTNGVDRRHLILDAEVVEELVDRYRFHQPNDQPACEKHLFDAVAATHSVNVDDVARAREHISERGLNLDVNIPIGILFIPAVLAVIGRIERRFGDEAWPAVFALIIASVVVSALFVLVGEFWTSILQMIRVGSQHVGGRVARLPWKRHEPQIFLVFIVTFWIVFSLRRTLRRMWLGLDA